ncbi:MAG TPA: hypothetical protein VFK04_06115 [Gemmatimonadaceae bacterium]|jgi:hypothetical protein|nr:hypothetical protein [Gemmatimonadaceae bacterium]
MRKVLLFTAIGVALGYTWGWRDAHTNENDVVTRIVSSVGGSTRGELKNDPDHLLDSLSR